MVLAPNGAQHMLHSSKKGSLSKHNMGANPPSILRMEMRMGLLISKVSTACIYVTISINLRNKKLGPRSICLYLLVKTKCKIVRRFSGQAILEEGFPRSSVVKNLPVNAGDVGSIPESGKIPPRRKWQPIPAFSHGKVPWTGAWRATVHGIAKSLA